MSLPTSLMLIIYCALLLALGLIVRRAYVRGRTGPRPKRYGLPSAPPREERKRLFDWSMEQ
jgi:hypothetical protein